VRYRIGVLAFPTTIDQEIVMSCSFKALTPMLQTTNMENTIAWYASVLGFQCTAREAEVWSRLQRDAVTLMFMRNDHLGAPSATATQYIYVDNVLSLWDTIRDRVAAEWGPEEMPYGMLEFAIKDPNGYLLSFGQPLPED
jgi:uncharacterized glyoxalase superfamily protein PhnB